MVRAEVQDDLFEMQSGADPVRVKEVIRDELRRMLQTQKLGLESSLAAIDGVPPSEFANYVKEAARTSIELSKRHLISIEDRIAKAKAKYTFINLKKPQNE